MSNVKLPAEEYVVATTEQITAAFKLWREEEDAAPEGYYSESDPDTLSKDERAKKDAETFLEFLEQTVK